MTNTEQTRQRDPRTERIQSATGALEEFGSLEVNGHLFTLDGWELRVYNVASRQLVAFSCTKADYPQSVAEFLGDFGG